MCKQVFSAIKLVCLVTLLCYSTLALPLSAGALKKLSETRSDFGSHKFQDTAASTATTNKLSAKTDETSAKVLSYSNDNDGLGSYKFAYDTENGIHQSEEGNLKQIGDVAAVAAQGSYGYSGPNGEKISVVYVADENGYRPKVLISLLSAPLGPPVPEAAPALVASLVG